MMKCVLAILILTAGVSVVSAQEAQLAWQFKKGDAFSVTCEQTDEFLSRIDTRDRSVENEVTLGLDWNVTAVDAQGTATINQSITRIRLKSGAPGEEIKKAIELDTADENAKLLGVSRDFMKLIKPIVGLTYSLQVDKSGKVLSVTVDKAAQATIDTLPADNQFAQLLQPGIMQGLLARSLPLPEQKIKADQSWDDAGQIDFAGGKLDRTTTWKVQSLDANSANLELTHKLDQGAAAAPVQGSFTAAPTISAYSGNGNLVFDRKAGYLKSFRVESEILARTLYRTDRVDTTLKSLSQTTIAKKE